MSYYKIKAIYLSKAKRIDNGEWVEGYLIFSFTGIPYIVQEYNHILEVIQMYEVDISTICRCTGLKDKNERLIWENDIVRTVYDGNEHIYQVVWDESELGFKATNGKENYESNFEYLPCCDEIEILGNIRHFHRGRE